MIEQGRFIERLINPEIPSSPDHFAGLHPRLLMGGAFLNPAVQIETITTEAFGDFSQREYSPFSKASVRERRSYWNQRNEITYQDRYQAWITGCVTTFESAKTFFADTDKGKNWSEFYGKLGIDTQNFTSQTAEGLHNRYFQNSKSGIKQFVADVYNAHAQGGRVNMAELEANLSAIGWLSKIFGNVSSEVITQMVMAEARLVSDPDQLLHQASSRINNLNSDEQRLLNFLWETPMESLKFRYERLGDPRVFPREENIQHLLNPARIAAVLRQAKPEKYGQRPQDQLTREIAAEQVQFNLWRNDKGLTDEYLGEIVLQTLNDYESFLTEKYGINLPTINNVQLVPVVGKTAENFGQSPGRFAFVDARRPAIFMDFDVIYAEAERLGRAEHKAATGRQLLGEMPPGKIRSLIMRLLREVNPHEYSHLIGDMAFWKVIKQTGGQEQLIDTITAKGGLRVAKIVNDQIPLDLLERGRGLNEAVTVELTDQWAKSFNAHLDIPVYGAERRILHSLINLLAEEQRISEEEAFKKMAVGYFTPQGFRHLVEELSGKVVDLNKKRIPHEGVTFKRPHFMQIVYALMEYEKGTNYPLTLEYINYANNLRVAPEAFKGYMADLIRFSRQLGSPIELSSRATKYLTEQGGIEWEVK